MRVFKVTLTSGEQEILVTNLRAKYLSRREIGELYFKRWRIEVKLDSLKNKLELEKLCAVLLKSGPTDILHAWRLEIRSSATGVNRFYAKLTTSLNT